MEKSKSMVESILYPFHVIPLVRKRSVALHPTSTGAAALWRRCSTLSTSWEVEGSVARGSALPFLPMSSCMAHCSPIHSLPKGEGVQARSSPSCRNEGNKSPSWWCVAGFCGSSWTSRSWALLLIVYPKKGLCRLLWECKLIYLPFLTKKLPLSPVFQLIFFVKVQRCSQI